MLDIIGWIGAITFAICAAPQAWKAYKDGHSDGVSWGFINLWLVGEICTTIYILPKQDWPLLFNYAGNLICLLVIMKYKMFPRIEVVYVSDEEALHAVLQAMEEHKDTLAKLKD
jgi:hypothetical protein